MGNSILTVTKRLVFSTNLNFITQKEIISLRTAHLKKIKNRDIKEYEQKQAFNYDVQ